MPDSAYVVDTGVFLRWFVPQVGFEHAREVRDRFLAGELALETADFVRAELAHVLRTKGLLPGRLDRTQYLSSVRSLDDLEVVVHPTDVDALERSAAVAADHNLRVFDAILVFRALDRGLALLTSDARLCRVADSLISTELLRGIEMRRTRPYVAVVSVDVLLGRIADDLRPLTSRLLVEVAFVVPVSWAGCMSPTLLANGSASAVSLDVADVLRPALAVGASQLVLVHNHPHGGPASPADDAFTRRLVAACAVIGLRLRGHLVLLPEGWIDCLGAPTDEQFHRWDGEARAIRVELRGDPC